MWISGKKGHVLTVTTIDGGYFVVCQDQKTNKFRLVNLEYGWVDGEEFDTLDDLLNVLKSMDCFVGRKAFV